VTVFEKPGFLAVHFVNAVGRSPLDEVTEIAGVSARIEIPRAMRVRQVRTLLGGIALPFDQRDGRVRFRLPQLGAYEVVVMETAV
jgi:hypothetical protein